MRLEYFLSQETQMGISQMIRYKVILTNEIRECRMGDSVCWQNGLWVKSRYGDNLVLTNLDSTKYCLIRIKTQ